MPIIKSIFFVTVWLLTLTVSCLLTVSTLVVIYPDALDKCDVTDQSFNTPIGWLIVCIFLLLTTGVGIFFHQMFGLSRAIIALGLSGLSVVFLLLLLVIGNGC